MDDSHISEDIKSLLKDALSLSDSESISSDSNIIKDLGAESIDFIDICFRIEQIFGLKKVNATEIFPFQYLEEEIFADDKSLASQFIIDLKTKYSHIDADILKDVTTTGKKSKLYSVEVLEKYIKNHLQ